MMSNAPFDITATTHEANSSCPSPRMRFLMYHLIQHLHDFARSTRLTTSEWLAAIEFLTSVGQTCAPTRQEFILLSDVLGLSTLVDGMDHPKPPGATEGTVLGPFHTDDAEFVEHGQSIASEGKGEPMLVQCTIKDTDGKPVEGVAVDVWQADQWGMYDTQYQVRDKVDCRGVLRSDKEGRVWFKGVKPVPYPIPHDGPVGAMMKKLNRHPYRPSHVHFKITKEGYDELVTALYLRTDPYVSSDAVFGVKPSLVFDLNKFEDEETANAYGMEVGDWILKWDFVIVTTEEAKEIKDAECRESLKQLGITATLVDGLPVADELD